MPEGAIARVPQPEHRARAAQKQHAGGSPKGCRVLAVEGLEEDMSWSRVLSAEGASHRKHAGGARALRPGILSTCALLGGAAGLFNPWLCYQHLSLVVGCSPSLHPPPCSPSPPSSPAHQLCPDSHPAPKTQGHVNVFVAVKRLGWVCASVVPSGAKEPTKTPCKHSGQAVCIP
eukprot:scaffold237394_cov19-Tisochrysis_lutea.AAC.1